MAQVKSWRTSARAERDANMTITAVPVQWLRGLRRAYKLGILMFAAWTPLALPRHPFVAAAILMTATALFFLATRAGAARLSSEPEPREQVDAAS